MKYKTNKYGTKFWYNKNNEYHREDGPAIEYSNGDKVWYLNDYSYEECLYNIIIYLRNNNL